MDYTNDLQPDFSPAWIDYVLRAKGFAPPRVESSPGAFRHVDLGCGSGLTTLMLAAAYPEATCIGIDANANMIEAATALAAKADLPNARFIPARFGDPALKAAENADYVTANGVYSWVAAPTRDQFIETVKALRAPNGVAVVSLNLTPGWLAMAPTQRLLNDAARGGAPLMDRLDAARSFLQVAAETGRRPELAGGAERVDELGDTYGPAYLAHEFLAGGWSAFWTSDLAQHMQPMAYRATTYLDLLRDDFALTKAERAALEASPTADAALSFRDITHGRAHARAIFQPEGAPLSPTRLTGWTQLIAPANSVDYVCKTPAGSLSFDNALAHRIVAALADGPHATSELFAESGASSEAAFWRVLDALMASRQAIPTAAPKSPDGADRLKAALAEAKIIIPRAPSRYGTPAPE